MLIRFTAGFEMLIPSNGGFEIKYLFALARFEKILRINLKEIPSRHVISY